MNKVKEEYKHIKVIKPGMVFGKLTIKERKGSSKDGCMVFLCICECGNSIETVSSYLKTGSRSNCETCRQKLVLDNIRKVSIKNKTHGMTNTRLYNIWRKIKDRCNNPNNSKYHIYGGRGITYHLEWRKFEPFLHWALSNGYSNNLTIDRINTNGDYSPSNCRWVPTKIQANNRRNNIKIRYLGEERTISEWSDYLDIPFSRINRRYHQYGWRDPEKLFCQKLKSWEMAKHKVGDANVGSSHVL